MSRTKVEQLGRRRRRELTRTTSLWLGVYILGDHLTTGKTRKVLGSKINREMRKVGPK